MRDQGTALPPADRSRRRRRAAFALAALLAAGAIPSVFAQVEATADYLSRIDSDHDGRVALEEYLAWMSYAFAAMDLNHDEVLTPDEMPGGRGKPLSLAEHRQILSERFRLQDTDQDGYLSAKELAAPPR